ncbi:MAG: hypothetical protein Q9218_002300 [Villophora microphyllina]
MPKQGLYEPLQERTIRLLELLPGTNGDNLRGQLLNARLESDQAYEALSYVWGSETNKVVLDCAGFQLPITPNLAAALRHLRLPRKSRTIWIDSICINQDDIPERNDQVILMSHIYRKASRVLVWLGDEDENNEDTAKAFACMGLLQTRIVPRLDELRNWKDKAVAAPDEARNSKINASFRLPPTDSPHFVALGQLLRRPWCTRAWTFQESLVAQVKSFICGNHQVDGDDIIHVAGALVHLYDCTKDKRYISCDVGYLNTMTARESLWNYAENGVPSKVRTSLLSLLSQRRGSGCKDPRDQIYSLIGVASDGIPISPDYGRSFEFVFASSTAQIISTTGSLAIFGQLFGDMEQTTLPTWVPDWRQRFDSRGQYKAYHSFTSVTGRRYSCTGSSKPLIQLSSCGREITIQGLNWDIVQAVKTGTLADMCHWIEQQHPSAVYRPTREPLSTAFERLICTDRALLDRHQVKPRWDSNNRPATAALANDPDALDEMVKNLWNKGVAMTQRNCLALVPEWANPTDIICWLMGGEVPILLRHDPTDGKYTLVGECYVHGFMDGEVLVEAQRSAELAKPLDRIDINDDKRDTSWLHRLHEQPLPFSTTEFTIK